MARAASVELAALRERFSVGDSATAAAATACGTCSTGRARATRFACCTTTARTTLIIAARAATTRPRVTLTAGTRDVAATGSTCVAAGCTRSAVTWAAVPRTAPAAPADMAATHAVVMVRAAVSVIVPTAALVAARICACSALGSFIGDLVDVLVVVDAGIAARAAHLTLTTAQARRVAGSIDGIARRTAATSCKSNQTTAGEQQLTHVLGFHVHPPSE
jgi:hypothetical protein